MTEHTEPGVGPNTPAEPGPSDVPPEYQEEEHYEEHKTTRKRVVEGILGDKMALFGAIVVVLFIFTAVFAPYVAPHDPEATFGFMQGPNSYSEGNYDADASIDRVWHPLGTDSFGHDVLSRMIYGARVSLLVALATVAVAFTLGTAIGLLAGFYGGWVDSVLMRYVDFQWAFPELILGVGIIALSGGLGVTNVVIAIGIAYIDDFARLVRGEVLSLREEEYVMAARAIGMSNRRIMTREILPNAVAPLIVQATLMIPLAILAEAGLSFLGLGVKPTTPTWGLLLSDGRQFIGDAWWISVMPGFAIMLTVLAFNMLGDGLRDVFDVSEGEVESR
ncbi:peptide/nickel transport system permease protein [Haladaptatus litoreus]|uniref:Peptide/nickel transport system permease protein n=1 Tax=Haladaptatus litoreus TaxID=553468 RepID=A0A1N7DZS5_9EURY|nr:ABC transporter permease [Haladaptatus litoreus]SIR81329.1 peptide/nickel transport system permease protein [Haladaptatus litoreus]